MIDPADGLPVRTVGEWSRRKHFFLERYVDMFATGMKDKWHGRTTFVDLFAGPGRWADEDTGEILDGSPLIGAGHPFGNLVMVDADPTSTAALSVRLAALGHGSRTTVLTGDCNDLVDDVIALIPKSGLALAFIDPTNWQVRFDTMRRLATARKVDVILTFHDRAMTRVAHLAATPAVDAFFGRPDWRTFAAKPGGGLAVGRLLDLYREQMVGLDYLGRVSRDPPVRNSRTNMYRLAFFSRHALGYQFWDTACSREDTGQTLLGL